MNNLETLLKDLPDREAAARFYEKLAADHASSIRILTKDEALLSDLLALAAFSPLLSTTILRNPDYISWLQRERLTTTVKEKEELLESLARFAMTNSTLEDGVVIARFRRRELIRIYLKDLRGLGTIAEITEDISNLADALLEYALRIAQQEMENRHGMPLALDSKRKQMRAGFCIAALGKLGSRELNYSSDIDLLFLFSSDGETSGAGSKGATTNREYFVKLAELVTKLVGAQTGEGAAYRVDVRLRPHGRVGPLAITESEAFRYYRDEARVWERQVLIRSRSSAGDADLFESFISSVVPFVFSAELSAKEALAHVRASKEKIDAGKQPGNGFDVKLGKGGIREIEFIAQALQLAYGGSDKWLRSSHTLISLSRLADRGHISESEQTKLFDAYTFLRRLEHRLQMENGLQTHFVPDDLLKRLLISQRMGLHFVADFNDQLEYHTGSVHTIFTRIFGTDVDVFLDSRQTPLDSRKKEDRELGRLFSSLEKTEGESVPVTAEFDTLKLISKIAPPFARMLTANPNLVGQLPGRNQPFKATDLSGSMFDAVMNSDHYAGRLSEMRKFWSRTICRIAAFEVFETITPEISRNAQTRLAEASIKTAVAVVKDELRRIYALEFDDFPIAVLGLGKLGGGSIDFGSDLDLVIVYDDEVPCPVPTTTHAEFYSKAVELFVSSLSGMTRDGSLYRVDLRLRPDGKNGATATGKTVLIRYLQERAAVWEWLAYVKLRGVYSESDLAVETEAAARESILNAASGVEREKLRSESYEIRKRLENQRTRRIKRGEVDLKFSEGGLQDVYFAIRYLQLRDGIPDDPENRSTLNSLQKLRNNESLSIENYMRFKHGYTFLSLLDHNLRLCNGRSSRLPSSESETLRIVAERMKLESTGALLGEFTTHRINIREAFDDVFEANV